MDITYENTQTVSNTIDNTQWLDSFEAHSVPEAKEISASFIARDNNGQVSGILLAAHKEPEEYGYPTVYISSISVEKNIRGKGIGSQLLKAFTAHADLLNSHSSLRVYHSSPAIKLYERFDFHIVDAIDDGETLTMLRPNLNALDRP